ncbi:hypothetical protein ABZ038_13045 [Streptomyces sp. NPDC006349]|uniref:hypothetical protein n=1 Tax=Streptomyces sp. NPDC006349 TaxID=3156757 RepID=UPI0033B936E8
MLIGPPGFPLRFDTVVPVPGDLLERLTYTSRRGERLLKHVEDGRLIRSTSLQGIHRLAADSAEELDQLIRHAGPSAGADEV